ncbi:unnamed protein product, partial [Caretta caretta]
MRVQMLAVLLLFVSLFCAEGIHGMSLAGGSESQTRRVQGDGEERSGSEFRWLSLLLFLLSWVARLWDLLRLL